MGQFKTNESLQMLNGVVAPPQVLDGETVILKPTLLELVAQSALEQAIDFYENPVDLGDEPTLSELPTEAELLSQKTWQSANRYENKTYRLSDDILQNDSETFRRLLKIVITQFSVSYNLNSFVDKPITLWENRVTEVIKRAIEILAKVKLEEKTAYETFIV